jgi:uncharacterized protein (DUF1786 family)
MDEIPLQHDKDRVKEMMRMRIVDNVDEKVVEKSQNVYVVGFDMPFFDMVAFMIKWALASIPAAFILFVAGAVIAGMFGKY